MPLQIGTRLGPYEVTGTLGAGGMGEVYRARDGRLGRDVALKVLPDAFATDPERLARFQREAQVLASLSHPHIGAIFGLEEGPPHGPSEAGHTVRALVLELVEGATLADRIAIGPIPFEEVLPIAKQIAAALETAHEQGIVHRDLKPANIKITPGGTVKVLDFGLAKLAQATSPGTHASTPSLSMSPTMASPAMMTGVGMILGTAAYMSPEQAKGREADKRSDVWAFGCVLFEMLSGKRPFEGEDVSDMLAAVLRGEPDWAILPSTTPAAVLRLIRRCLRRDPQKRLRDIGDARLELEELAAEAEPGADAGRGSESRPARWRTILPWGMAVMATALSLLLLAWRPGELPVGPRVTRAEISMPPGVELYTLSGGLGISPDGSRVAFIGIVGAVRQVYIRRIDRFEAEPVRGAETASWCCAFSPDGAQLAFATADGALRKVSLSDGLVTIVATDTGRLGASWLDRESLVFVRAGALMRIGASGGEATELLASEDGRLHAWPMALPAGGAVLFASRETGGDTWRIESYNLATRARHVVVERGTLPLYSTTDHLIFYRDSELLAAPFDTGEQRMTGDTVRILANVPATATGVPLVGMSDTGVLAYAPTTASARLVWVSRQGAELPLLETPRIYANPRLDPRGRWVLVATDDLWVHDLTRGSFSRVSSVPDGVLGGAFPVLTPDGTRAVYRNPTGLSWVSLDGSGETGTIAGTTAQDYPGSIAPDGEQILFVRLNPDSSGDIYVASLRGDPNVRPLVQTPGYDGSARLSPDGRWLLYTSNESGRYDVYLRPYPGPGPRLSVSTRGGTQPLWNPNGREIFYRQDDRMMAVTLSGTDKVVLSEPTLLFEQRYAFGGGLTIPNYDVSADGQRFVMVKEESTASRLNLVLNWFDELQARVSAP